ARPAWRRGWWRSAGLAVVMVLLFVAGYSTHALVQMWSTPDDGSAGAGFARDMAAHHAQAVEMALIAWQRASQPETRTMAYATVTAQQAEIGSAPPMAWVPDRGRMLGADGRMPGMASPAEVAALETAKARRSTCCSAS